MSSAYIGDHFREEVARLSEKETIVRTDKGKASVINREVTRMKIGTDGFLRNLLDASNKLAKATEQLSSGKRINRAADDAAGLAIAQALLSDEKVLSKASENIDYGRSLGEIQDSALASIGNIETRRAELATQAANGTLSDEQRVALDAEYQALGEEEARIVATTNFNGINPLQSSVTLQVGTSSSASSQITLNSGDVSSLVGGSSNLLTADAARQSLDTANSRISSLASTRGELGASISRLDSADESVSSSIEQTTRARSRIEDADIATTLSNKIAADIQQNTTTALLAQAGRVNKNIALGLLT